MFSVKSKEQLDVLEFSKPPALVKSCVLQILYSYVSALIQTINTDLTEVGNSAVTLLCQV